MTSCPHPDESIQISLPFFGGGWVNMVHSDLDHLKVDMSRAYILVVSEWASYMKHLKNDYPYLFSIAVRTNPFNPEAEIVIS